MYIRSALDTSAITMGAQNIAALLEAIAILITAAVSLWNTIAFVKNAAKQSILQMIDEDKLAVLMGNLPENYQNIMYELDRYTKRGGNSYVKKKVEDYYKWYEGLNIKNDK